VAPVSRAVEPKKVAAVKGNGTGVSSTQHSRTRMINQLSGLNSNPMHVLSAGAGDLLLNNGTGSISPTYQNFAFHANAGAKLNPYFTSASGLNTAAD
jgi:hypothetical protein